MSKSGVCSCGESVTIPKSECVFVCHRCGGVGVFVCHVLGQPKDPMHMRCKECKLIYSMYNCPQCQAFAVIKGFQPGKMYNCLCGFQATMLACNKCNALLCLPTRNNYELTTISCKKCTQQFAYRLCPACGEIAYLRPNQRAEEAVLCFNEQCRLFQSAPQKQAAKLPAEEKKVEVESNPYEQLLPSQKKESELCNICLSKKKCMINTTCYHLSVCEGCSRDLGGRCPICRAPGEYKMVFDS